MGYIKDALRLHIYWWGVYFGLFYMPGVVLSQVGTLLFVPFIFATVLTGLVVFVADPIRRWHGSLGKATVVRLLASSLTTVLLIAFNTVVFGDLKETATLNSIPWVLYAVMLLVRYSNERHKRSEQHQPIRR